MRQSKSKNGFTRIDHVTFDLVIPTLSTAAQSVFLRIYRQTAGWRKTTDKISNGHFQEKCNIKNHETVSIAIDELKGKNLITVSGTATQIKEFGINYDELTRIKQVYMESQEDEK